MTDNRQSLADLASLTNQPAPAAPAAQSLPTSEGDIAAPVSNEPVRERGMWPTSRLSARMRDEDHGSVKVIAAGVEG